ncbi:uncharacterized protein LOC108864482 [Galendromus occidentalis]|uniref:Uncharacterized protein LOC108864482 n=1 Tax=Galendromus occidentalis TaxID=34638 RepID=A0AAJ7WI02_9ACAR|nr:uncharacterized protein LOC108864482 [Galendromus occidentalis]
MLPVPVRLPLLLLLCFEASCTVAPEQHIEVGHVWSTVWAYYSTESAFRCLDVNGDGVEDVIVGFATGVTRPNAAGCWELFAIQTEFCGGGIAALDGVQGDLIWRTFSRNEIYALTCSLDIDDDGVYDCVGAGRMSTMLAVSAVSGSTLWTVDISNPALVTISNFYTAQPIIDVDGDGLEDFLNINGGDPFKKKGEQTRFSARLVIVSSRSGEIIQWNKVPDEIESYNSPLVLNYKNGSKYILFGTGGETTPGSLWVLDLNDLIATKSTRSARKLLQDSEKGFMVPPVLVDLDLDGVRDIVLAPFGSRVFALSGKDFSLLWKYEERPQAETYSTPAIGYYNDDVVPDILVQFSHGPGFPIYSDAVVRVLDGKSGVPFDGSTKSLIAVQSSPLTISREGLGNDIFVYAASDCEGHEENGSLSVMSSNVSTYKVFPAPPPIFLPDSDRGNIENHSAILIRKRAPSAPRPSECDLNELSDVPIYSLMQLSRTNMCKMRFADAPKMNTKIYAMSREIGFPGVEIYSSMKQRDTEYSQAAMLWRARRVTTFMRSRRHVGAHDGDGLLRTISTGMLTGANESGVLFTFAAFWSYNPVPRCVEDKLKLEVFRFNTSSMKDQDHDAFKENAEDECGSESEIEGDLMSQTTIHRIWLKTSSGRVSATQRWSQYMGYDGDSYA